MDEKDEAVGEKFFRPAWNDPDALSEYDGGIGPHRTNLRQVGALVRLVREILEAASFRDADVENIRDLRSGNLTLEYAAKRSIAWLAEARKLVGEV